MCYTYNASITSFTVNFIGCIILAYYTPAIAMFLFFVGFMQLFDAIFWFNQQKNLTNFLVTKLAMVFNHLQPIVLAFCIFYIAKKELRNLSFYTLVVYTVAAIIYTCYHWNSVSYTLVTDKSSPGLYWEWNHLVGAEIFYALFMFTFIVLLYENIVSPYNYILIVFTIGTYLLSLYYFKTKTVGRYWCFYAAYVSFFIVGILVITKKRSITI